MNLERLHVQCSWNVDILHVTLRFHAIINTCMTIATALLKYIKHTVVRFLSFSGDGPEGWGVTGGLDPPEK